MMSVQVLCRGVNDDIGSMGDRLAVHRAGERRIDDQRHALRVAAEETVQRVVDDPPERLRSTIHSPGDQVADPQGVGHSHSRVGVGGDECP